MIYRFIKDIGDYRPLNGSGTLNEPQLLWLYVMRSAERLDEEKQMCDGCRTNRALGIMKPPSCVQCGKEVSSYYREDREEHLKAFIAYRKSLLPNKDQQNQIEAELDAEIAREDEQNVRE